MNLEESVNEALRAKSKLEVTLSRPYKPYGYTHAGYLLDSLYAGKAWHTLRECKILAELPERRRN